jgi:hypothetical protein
MIIARCVLLALLMPLLLFAVLLMLFAYPFQSEVSYVRNTNPKNIV